FRRTLEDRTAAAVMGGQHRLAGGTAVAKGGARTAALTPPERRATPLPHRPNLLVHLVGVLGLGHDFLDGSQRVVVVREPTQVLAAADVVAPPARVVTPGILGGALMYWRTLFTLDGVAIAV
ncbi:MAG TPA: hypothetical protein VMQ38_01635, partial [Mycobacterium sp.]|nr:hypothetical protein [Mycobacterium sp.]